MGKGVVAGQEGLAGCGCEVTGGIEMTFFEEV